MGQNDADEEARYREMCRLAIEAGLAWEPQDGDWIWQRLKGLPPDFLFHGSCTRHFICQLLLEEGWELVPCFREDQLRGMLDWNWLSFDDECMGMAVEITGPDILSYEGIAQRLSKREAALMVVMKEKLGLVWRDGAWRKAEEEKP